MAGKNSDEVSFVPKSLLDRAKAYLCWDYFRGLNILLIEIQESVAFFHPSFTEDTILLFHERGIRNFRIPLFHLFHEAGHALQYLRLGDKKELFLQTIQIGSGPQRLSFEREAWEMGRTILEKFLRLEGQVPELISEYVLFSQKAVETYSDGELNESIGPASYRF